MSTFVSANQTSASSERALTIDATAYSRYHLVEACDKPARPEVSVIPKIRSTHSLLGEGWVDYDFVVPASGWYAVGFGGVTDASDHDFYIDSVHIYGGFGGKIANAWLGAGSHVLRVQRYTYSGLAPFASFTITASAGAVASSVRVEPENTSLIFRVGEALKLNVHTGGRTSAGALTVWVKEANTDAVIRTYSVVLPAASNEVIQRLTIPYAKEGLYYVTFGDAGKPVAASDVREIEYLVVDTTHNDQPVGGDIKRTLIKQIDCGATPPDYAGGITNAIHTPIGVYRQSGDRGYLQSKDFHWFTYRLDVPEAQKPYVVEVDYPDDDCRTFGIALMERNMMDYPPVGGVDSGGVFSLSHEMQTQSFIYYPRGKEVVISFINTRDGRTAAAARIRLYSVHAPIPALGTPREGGRSFGSWLEEGDRWATFYGAPDKSLNGYVVSMNRWAQVARYMGLDTLSPTVNIYQNVLFPTTYFDGYFRPAGGARDPMPLDVVRLLLLVCEKYELKLLPEFHPCGNAYHLHDYDAKYASYPDPQPQRIVGKDGQVGHSNFEPYYNPIYPDNRQWYIGMLGEFADQYKDSAALDGVSLRVMGWVGEGHNGYPSLKWGYEDYTVHLFEKQTGTRVQVKDTDPERFRKRYDWLMAKCKAKWIDWRCDQVVKLYADIRDRVRKARPNLFVVSPIHPELDGTYYDEKERFFTTHDYSELLRECGYDTRKMAALDGVFFLNAFHYYGRRQSEAVSEQASRDMLLNPAAKKALIVNTNRTGYLFSNGYFEANQKIKPADMGLAGVKPGGWVALVNPAGRHYLERYALSVAEGDASMILDGGEGYLGGQPLLREFLAEYRQLPVARFMPRPDATDPVSVWQLNDRKRFWFYAVNRERYPIRVAIHLSGAGVVTRPALAETVPAKNGIIEIVLAPYQMAVWKCAPTRAIATVDVAVPREAKERATAMVLWIERFDASVQSGKAGQSLNAAQKATLHKYALEARACVVRMHYWRARTLMESHELLPIYDLLGAAPPALAEYRVPPMPLNAMQAGELLACASTVSGADISTVSSESVDPQWAGGKLLVTSEASTQIRVANPVAGKYSLTICHVAGGDYGPLNVAIGNVSLGATSDPSKTPSLVLSPFAPVVLGAGDQAITLTRPHGTVTAINWISLSPVYRDLVRSDWSTVGPFPSPLVQYTVADGFQHAFDPELSRNFGANVPLTTDGAYATWERGSGDGAYIDLFDKYHKVGEVLSYGVTYVYAPTDRIATLSYDVDWWAKLWVNGEKLADFTDARPPKAPNGRFATDVRLKKGWNKILIKVQSGSAGNGYWMAISDPGDLCVSPTPPQGEVSQPAMSCLDTSR